MGKNKTIYLDYNATTPVLPQVKKAVLAAMEQPFNPSSIHAYGREGRKIVENARKQLMDAVKADGAQVIFTSSGTEANNLAITGCKAAATLVVSSIEHPSVLKIAETHKAWLIPVDERGVVSLTALEKMLACLEEKPLVSVMLANNETGVIQPVKEIAQLVYRHGGYMHCDASQALGKIPLDFTELNVDMMTLSAHKCGGALGAAALIIKKGMVLNPAQIGGGQESGYRAGTENVPAIAGFGVAASHAATVSSELRDYLEREIATIAPDAIIFGKGAERLPNTSCIALPGMSGETQLIAFDLAGVAVSSGSACSSGKVGISHVLLAMGVDKTLAASAVRVSVGQGTTKEDIDAFLNVWKRNYDKQKTKAAPPKMAKAKAA